MTHTSALRVIFILLFSIRAHAAATPSVGLEELFQAGLSASETLVQKEEELLQAKEIRSQGRSTFLPTLNFVGTYTKQDTPSSALGRNISPTTQKTARFTARQYIFQGGSEYSYLNQTDKYFEAAQESVKAQKQQLYLDIADLYLNSLLKEKELSHNETELKLYDDQIKELRARAKIGRSRPSDVLTVEAARAGVIAKIKLSETDLKNSRTQLASLTRTSPEATLKEAKYDWEKLAPLDYYLKSLETSPGLKSASLNREAVESGIGFARGSHFPSLDVSGNYYLERPGVNSDTKWDASLNLTVPIFAGGATQSKVRAAASQYRVSEVLYQKQTRELHDTIKNLYQNLTSSEAELKAMNEAESLFEKNYQQIRKDFRYGLVTNLDLVQALKNLQDSRRSLDQTRYRHTLERVRLEVASGLLPKNI